MTKLVAPGASSMTPDQQRQEAAATSVFGKHVVADCSSALAAEPKIAVGFALRCGVIQ